MIVHLAARYRCVPVKSNVRAHVPTSRATRDKGRETVAALRSLWNEWDPIGVASPALQDEYDSYLAPTLSMLERGATEDGLAEYLSHLVRDYIGLGEEGVEYSKPREFARDLQAWFKSRKEGSGEL